MIPNPSSVAYSRRNFMKLSHFLYVVYNKLSLLVFAISKCYGSRYKSLYRNRDDSTGSHEKLVNSEP